MTSRRKPRDGQPAPIRGGQAETVTLADVARLAGVSPMTVSNVVNGLSSVRPENRDRVLAAITQTGYRANLLARALAGGRNQMISVYSPQLNRPYAAEIVQGAARAAEALNLDLTVMMLGENNASDLSMLTPLCIGALLIQPTSRSRWRRSDLPAHVVSIDGPGERCLTVDNYGGACLAVQHLQRLGHRRIAFVSGLNDEERLISSPQGLAHLALPRRDRDDADERLRGYLESMAAMKLKVPRGYVQHGDYTKASGERAARRLLALSRPPTAIFVAGDAMALGAIHAAQDAHLRVPEDLSVVGFDDLPIAAASRPGLSTVRQPLQEMGDAAVRLLVALAQGQSVPTPTPFTTRLVLRESAAGPPR
jgi:LacI family transcriptional regulator